LTEPGTAAKGLQTGRLLEEYSYRQPTSVFREPSWLGAYLLSALVFFGFLLVSRTRRASLFQSQPLNWLMLSIIAFGLLSTVALGPLISLLVFIGLIFVLRRRSWSGVIRLAAVLMLAALLAASALQAMGIDFYGAAAARAGGLVQDVVYGRGGDTSLRSRLDGTRAALEVWASHPILGVGLNNTHYHTGPDILNTCNGWARLLSDQGIVGFAAMATIIGSLLLSLNRASTSVPESSWWYPLVVALFLLLTVEAVNTVSTFNWTSPIRWFALAMANLVYVQAVNQFVPGSQRVSSVVGRAGSARQPHGSKGVIRR
jgi:O-antigen ligase